MNNLWLALQSLYALAFARNDEALIDAVGASMAAASAINCRSSFGLHTEFSNPAPVSAAEIENIFATLAEPTHPLECYECDHVAAVPCDETGAFTTADAEKAGFTQVVRVGGTCFICAACMARFEAEAETSLTPSQLEAKEFAMYIPKPARRKITETQAEAILDAYATTEREATERNRGQEYRHTYHDLTPAQREAAALLHDEWRYLVFSVDCLGY